MKVEGGASAAQGPQRLNEKENYRIMVGLGWPRAVGILCEGAKDERIGEGGCCGCIGVMRIAMRYV